MMDEHTQQVYAAWQAYRAENGFPPTLTALADWMDWPYSEVQQALDELVRMGKLKRAKPQAVQP